MPIPVAAARYVRAIEFHPGNARVVHHANLGVDRTRSSRQLDAARSRARLRRQHGARRALSGRAAARVDAGTGAASVRRTGTQWRLEPGSDLVVQLHLQPTGKAERVGVSVGFFFTDDAADADAGRPAPGQRDDRHPAGGARLRRRRSLSVCRSTSRCWPSSRTRTTSRDGWKRGRSCPDGTTRWLIAIDDWDFRWQDVYRYAAPFVPAEGHRRSSMRYVYDNSAGNPRNPHHPPARVVWGQNTSDEMGDLWMQVIPRAAADEPILTADFRRKAHARRSGGATRSCCRPIRRTRCATTPWRACISTPGCSTRRSPSIRAVAAAESASRRRPTATWASRCRRAAGATRRSPRSRRRCASIPTTRRRTTTSARCCSSPGRATRRSSTTGAPRRCGRTTSRRTPTSGSCCRSADAARRRSRQFAEALALRDDNVQALAGPRVDSGDRFRIRRCGMPRSGIRLAERGRQARTSPGCNRD